MGKDSRSAGGSGHEVPTPERPERGPLDYDHRLRRGPATFESVVCKKTKKRKLRARRNKANHGKRPNVGRR